MTTAAPARSGSGLFAALLFCGLFLFILITLEPFASLQVTYASDLLSSANPLVRQVLFIGMTGAVLAVLWSEGKLGLLLQPRWLILAVFGWLALTSVMGLAPSTSLRRLVEAGIVCVAAGAMLLLPRNERQFGIMLAACTLLVLAVCYGGVALNPARAIHQTWDYLEPALAGDWRGLFPHKNAAASVMALFIFIGLYLVRTGPKPAGWAVLVLSAIFLWMSGGKTALGMVPATLAAVWVIERLPALRHVVVFGAIGAFALVTVGLVMFPPLANLVASLGVDASFTGRTDIWTLAVDSIRAEPIFGYGFESFWNRPELRTTFREVSNWAVAAAHAHNGYIDTLIAGGLPALGLALWWLVVLPLRDIGAARQGNGEHLTRLFTRLWFYVLMANMLETMFFAGARADWFLMLMAVFGLRLQARATLRQPSPATAREDQRHATPRRPGHKDPHPG